VTRAIFISYRRDDTEGEAGRLFDDLTRAFGNDAVFMDVAGIDPGIDFRKAIDDNVACCGVLLAMVGPTWATIAGSDGQRRLDNENDYVRLEIASALKRNVAVIPVLVHDARMPHSEQLPENLKDLAYRNSVEITHARWNSDVQLLIKALGQYVNATKETETDTVHATVPVQLPAPHPAEEPGLVRKKSNTPLMVGLAVLGALAIAMAVFFALHGHSSLDGRWTNPTPLDHNSLAQLEISGSGSELAVHAWGLCKPDNCDWGTQKASFDGKQAKATWNLTSDSSGEEKGRVAALTISAGDSGKLEVQVTNTFTGHAGNSRQFEFVRAQ
jgi:TIR domain